MLNVCLDILWNIEPDSKYCLGAECASKLKKHKEEKAFAQRPVEAVPPKTEMSLHDESINSQIIPTSHLTVLQGISHDCSNEKHLTLQKLLQKIGVQVAEIYVNMAKICTSCVTKTIETCTAH